MERELAFFEGRIVPIEEAKISIKTNSFHYGTAVFEGIRAYWNQEEGQLYILAGYEHYERLLKNAKAMFMEIPYTPQRLVEITRQLLKESGVREDIYIRPIVYFKDLIHKNEYLTGCDGYVFE